MISIQKINIKAVILGFLADTTGTILLFRLLATAMSSAGIPDTSITERMSGLSGLLLSLIMGLGCTCLGGYVAGRMAKQAELLQGAAAAFLSLVLGILLRETGHPLWYEVVGFGALIPAGIAGGYFAAIHRLRAASSADKR